MRSGFLSGFASKEEGIVSIIFALSLTAILASAGIATDLALAYNAKARLTSALDKAALAVGSTDSSTNNMQTVFENFFYANYPAESYGTTHDLTLTINDKDIVVSASVDVKTMFLGFFGTDTLTIKAESEVIKELAGVEAVLVLDITGSMAGTNITALKTASNNFINIMFNNITDTDYLKIGIVPYSNSVNVGSYGWGLYPDSSYYGLKFVDPPATDAYTTPASSIKYGTGTNDWGGCVIERTGLQMSDASSPNWGMYRYPKTCLSYNSKGVCTSYTSPNYYCTAAKVVPLTNNATTLHNSVNALVASGNTYSHLGMAWGWRVVSPDFPFSESVAYDDNKWTKTVILMTDGDNTIDSVYSGEGKAGATGVSTTATQENQKLAEVCQSMKDAGVRIYTITFKSSINATTKSFYRNCATSSSMYYDAPSNSDLIAAFEKIADQLSQLHVAK